MKTSRTVFDRFKTDGNNFDAGKLVEAILLFDTTLLSDPTVLPELIRSTGTDGVVQLFDSGLVRVVYGGPSAQATCDYRKPGFFTGKSLDRPLRYGFELIHQNPKTKGNTSDKELLQRALDKTKKIISIEDFELRTIRDLADNSARNIDNTSINYADDFRADVSDHRELIEEIIVEYLTSKVSTPLFGYEIEVSEVDDSVFQIDTNLGKIIGINDTELHELIKEPFFQLTGTHLQLQRMKAVNAVGGLTEAQANITAKRGDFLCSLIMELDTRGSFTQIVEVLDVPKVPPNAQIDIPGLIELRNSDEARAFRDFLQSQEGVDDKQIKELANDWRKKIGEKFKSPKGKKLRFLASSAISEALSMKFPLPGIGTAVNGLDQFLGKLISGMGPIGFIDGEYRRYIAKQL